MTPTIPGPSIDVVPPAPTPDPAPAEVPAPEVQPENDTVTEVEPLALVPPVIAPPATPENPIPGPVALVPVLPGPSLPAVKAKPTQVVHPARAVIRTALAVILGLVTLTPDLVSQAHLGNTALGAQALVVTAAVTRFLALPSVETFLAKWLPFLSAEPS